MARVRKMWGGEEEFDPDKIRSSVLEACRSVKDKDRMCEDIATEVTESIEEWLKGMEVVDSEKLRERVMEELRDIDMATAHSYEEKTFDRMS